MFLSRKKDGSYLLSTLLPMTEESYVGGLDVFPRYGDPGYVDHLSPTTVQNIIGNVDLPPLHFRRISMEVYLHDNDQVRCLAD